MVTQSLMRNEEALLSVSSSIELLKQNNIALQVSVKQYITGHQPQIVCVTWYFGLKPYSGKHSVILLSFFLYGSYACEQVCNQWSILLDKFERKWIYI